MRPFWRRAPLEAAESRGQDDLTGRDTPLDEIQEANEPSKPLPGERGIPSVNRVRTLQSRVSSLLAMGLMATLGVGLLTWYYARTLSRQTEKEVRIQSASRARAHGDLPLPSLGRIEPPKAEANSASSSLLGPAPEAPPSIAGAADEITAVPAPSAAAVAPSGTTPGQRSFERRLGGPSFARQSALQSPSSPAAPFTDAAPPSAASVGSLETPPPTGGSNLRGLLETTVTEAVPARILPTQRLLLAKGAFIDCTLETAIDSTLPGMTTCITATDTFSVDGKVVLLERGTKLVGETRGQVQQGMARLFVLWSEARTPTGVVVPLISPGTDELGRSGVAGEVDRHFWDRFGAAILISTIDGAVQSAVQGARESGDTVVVSPSSSQDIVTEVLRSTVNIPPTLRKPQGDRIQVLVARDLDFRGVYQLRLSREGR